MQTTPQFTIVATECEEGCTGIQDIVCLFVGDKETATKQFQAINKIKSELYQKWMQLNESLQLKIREQKTVHTNWPVSLEYQSKIRKFREAYEFELKLLKESFPFFQYNIHLLPNTDQSYT